MNCGMSEEALEAIERRVMAKVDYALADLSAIVMRTEIKLETLAPLTESLALAHVDTRAEMASLGAAVGELQCPKDDLFLSAVGDAVAELTARLKASEAKMNIAIAPVLESLTLSHMDTQVKLSELEGLDDSELQERLACLEQKVEVFCDSELQRKLASLERRLEEKLDDLKDNSDVNDSDLRVKLASVELRLQTQAKKETSPNNSIPAYLLDTGPESDLAPRCQIVNYSIPSDLSDELAKKSPFMKQVRSSSESRLQTPSHDGSKTELTPGRSKKTQRREKRMGGGDAAEWAVVDPLSMSVPFARTIGTRTLERQSGGRSLPYLPPTF